MNENPLISVIIPVYNIEPYIERCLRSVIAQTYKNLEIIVVDDGSTDNGGRICDKIATEDSRIKVIHQTNNGLSAARNTGIKESHGEYIGFVDGDDFIDSDMYEYLYALISDNHADISFCRFRHYGFPNQWQFKDDERSGIDILDGMSAMKAFFERKKDIPGYVWNGLYIKKIVVPFPVGFTSEDLEFKVNVFLKASVVVSGKEIKYNYFYRSDSLVRCGNYKRLGSDLFSIAQNIRKLIEPLNDNLLTRAFYARILKMGMGLLSGSVHSNCSGIPELRRLISTYSKLKYTGGEKWKAKLICLSMKINAVWPYKVAINISDFILGVVKKTKAIKKLSVSK